MGSLLHSLRNLPTPTLPGEPVDECRGKVPRSRADAERHAAYLMTLPGATPVEPYPCPHGDHWHVGAPMVKGFKPKTRSFKKRR
ncbi:hypothetical protein BAMBUS_03520 [Brevundimonas phage vB_BpoS-Bambus]|nr:hypothetical protein BAMBUS_03520 [Brevundimonas phage vB_BpoS-Bambus]